MSVPRLPFLWPHLFKGQYSFEGQAVRASLSRARPQLERAFHQTCRRRQLSQQRYGSAAEPLPPPPKPSEQGKQVAPEAADAAAGREANGKDSAVGEGKALQKDDKGAETGSRPPPQDAGKESMPVQEAHVVPTPDGARPLAELEKMLHLEPPTSRKQQKSPHLQAPPYVHHFDSHTLVKALQKDGFTEDQSITIMKAVRTLLAINLDVAKEELVSKSDIENVCHRPGPRAGNRY
jgi:hypothetical protein